MTEEPFFARWSRRKREGEKDEPREIRGEAVPGQRAETPPVATPPDQRIAPKSEAPPFDPASLPPIESIGIDTDIRVFFAEGVPVELKRAALRRVWTADPAIRNFVGLAENAWDFTDPTAMPGFGPLEATDDVRRMIAQVVDQIGRSSREAAADPTSARAVDSENSNNDNAIIASRDDSAPPPVATSSNDGRDAQPHRLGNQALLQSNEENVAPQNNGTETQEKPKQFTRKTHGGALPK